MGIERGGRIPLSDKVKNLATHLRAQSIILTWLVGNLLSSYGGTFQTETKKAGIYRTISPVGNGMPLALYLIEMEVLP